MSTKGRLENNKKRKKMIEIYAKKRADLVSVMKDPNISQGEKFKTQLKLADLPRNSSKTRYRNRCAISGRGRGFIRYYGLSRIAFRELASKGMIPGVRKSSW